MNTNKKVIWITRTALFLAVAIIAQLIGANIGGQTFGQILTGSLVNMALITAGIVVGMSSGCAIAILTPCLAFLFGIMKFAPAIPVVMAGNIVIVVLSTLMYKYFTGSINKPAIEKIFVLVGMVIAAFIKCGVMWSSAKFILPLFVDVVPPALVISFGILQAITGSIGGIIAMLVIPSLLKVKRKD